MLLFLLHLGQFVVAEYTAGLTTSQVPANSTTILPGPSGSAAATSPAPPSEHSEIFIATETVLD